MPDQASDEVSNRFLCRGAVAAAALRHFLHVHVGFTGEEIRKGVLTALGIGIFLAIAVVR